MGKHRHGVLLLDDHDDTREAFAALVANADLDVTASGTGAEGLAHLRRDPQHWCLVLMDWWLGDMTGEQFLREKNADARIADVCVGVITGDVTVEKAAGQLAVDYFFLKPIDLDVLFRLLANHCDPRRPQTGAA